MPRFGEGFGWIIRAKEPPECLLAEPIIQVTSFFMSLEPSLCTMLLSLTLPEIDSYRGRIFPNVCHKLPESNLQLSDESAGTLTPYPIRLVSRTKPTRLPDAAIENKVNSQPYMLKNMLTVQTALNWISSGPRIRITIFYYLRLLQIFLSSLKAIVAWKT